MAELKLRLDLDKEEVELVVDDEVALSTGRDVFVSWVEAYNDKHKPVAPPAPVDVEPAPVVDSEAPVENDKPEGDNDAKVSDETSNSKETD